MAHGNRLAHELSPYLRQHAHNPVEWFPWGDAAFEAARSADKPLLLSIGYASCHWCHVMARESFEDPNVAALMNQHFVNVKVDREERPDVDAVYMAALQSMTGSGGWPLTMMLTPDGRPFYGGTYFPPTDRHGAPGFTRVLLSLAEAWSRRRDDVEAAAADLTQALGRLSASLPIASEPEPVEQLTVQALERLQQLEDHQHGGFGGAPKFPPHEVLKLLLTLPEQLGEWPLESVQRTLDAMMAGGIFDQLGGGFARYSVDDGWRVPHFEKMLYDNAAMIGNLAGAYRRSGAERYRQAALSTVAWLEREMKVSPNLDEAAFYSAVSADSEGEEGKFYAWTEAELRAVVGKADADLAALHFGVTTPGAFEGANVLRVAVPAAQLALDTGLSREEVAARLNAVKERLFEAREERVRPELDDKVLASWNGLLLASLADAGEALREPRLLELAHANVRFVRRHLWLDGRLWHLWRDGERRVEGLLEDYAYYGLGLLALYRATFDPKALMFALELADAVRERFHDPRGGGYFLTADGASELPVRPKGLVDAATPSENSAAAELVWWASRYRDDPAALSEADAALRGTDAAIAQAPQAFASSLRVRRLMAAPPRELVLAGDAGGRDLGRLLTVWRDQAGGPASSTVSLLLDGSDERLRSLPLAAGRWPESGDPARAYLCRGGVCALPVSDPQALEAQLKA